MPSQEAFDHVDAIVDHAQQAKAGVKPADRHRMMRNMLHAVQVQEGLITADSPDDFVRP
jgi:hypothetical protein